MGHSLVDEFAAADTTSPPFSSKKNKPKGSSRLEQLQAQAQCSDKSVWDIAIQSKRTGFNPKGNWAASGASAAAFEASDEDL